MPIRPNGSVVADLTGLTPEATFHNGAPAWELLWHEEKLKPELVSSGTADILGPQKLLRVTSWKRSIMICQRPSMGDLHQQGGSHALMSVVC